MTESSKRKLADRPWLAQLLVILTTLLTMLITIIAFNLLLLSPESASFQLFAPLIYHFITAFIIFPFLFKLPNGKTTLKKYMDDIWLTRSGPVLKLILLVLSCYLILAACQVGASVIWQLLRGFPVTWGFIRRVIDISGDLPPASAGLLLTIPSAFEELGTRGVMLQTFRRKYSDTQAIIFQAIGFGLIHLMNLANPGVEPVWVFGQVIWATIIGIFYGNLTLKTNALWPAMIIHYLGNAFIGSFTATMQASAPAHVQAIFGVTLTLGLVPAGLMILWTNFFAKRWLTD